MTHRRLVRTQLLILTRSMLLIAAICCVTGLLGSGAARADVAPLATVDGQPITSKDVDAALDQYYREAALRHLILQSLVDAQARAAGVTVSDADVDAAVARWKQDTFSGSEPLYRANLDRQGLTPALYRQVIRQGLQAQAIVGKTTALVDEDFDRVKINRYIIHNPMQQQILSQKIWQMQQAGAASVHIDMEPPGIDREILSVFRHDSRFDESVLYGVFNHAPLQAIGPIPLPNSPNFQVIQILGLEPGRNMSKDDRQVYAARLLNQKILRRMQDWWADLERQIDAIRAPK